MNRLSMNTKLTLVVAVFIIMLISVFAGGVLGMKRILKETDEFVDVHLEKRRIASLIITEGFIASGELKDLLLEDHPKEREEELASLTKELAALDKSWTELDPLMDAQSRPYFTSAHDKYQEWLAAIMQVRELGLKGTAEATKQAFDYNQEKAAPLRIAMNEQLDRMKELIERQVKADREENDGIADDVRTTMIAIMVVGLSIALSLAIYTMVNIRRGVDRTVEILDDTSRQVASAASEVASSSQSLSRTAVDQAASLEETASAVEQMSSMISKNSQSARASSDLSNKSVQSAVRGQEVLGAMMESMERIEQANLLVIQQTDRNNQKMSEIVGLIDEIGAKTLVIDEIVFQTKLLSFNASVEAARAGEHGKGFAVVAEEVGNLARMSGSAAKEISGLLQSSILKVQNMVAESKAEIGRIVADNAEKIQAGSQTAAECRAAFGEILQDISELSRMADSIAGASEEQARGINEINRAMVALDKVTQSNAGTSEQSAAASEQLSAQAEHMSGAVRDLVQVLHGEKAA